MPSPLEPLSLGAQFFSWHFIFHGLAFSRYAVKSMIVAVYGEQSAK